MDMFVSVRSRGQRQLENLFQSEHDGSTPRSARRSKIEMIEQHLERGVTHQPSAGYFTQNGEQPESIIETSYFRIGVCVLIGVNTIQMGIEVDYSDWPGWIVVGNIFTTLFFLEAVLKIFVLRSRYFKDRWNLLDFLLVFLSVLDDWILVWFDVASMLRSMSVLRALKLVRLVRVVRLVKGFSKLALVMQGIAEALESTVWVGIVLLFAIYIGSIFCTVIIGRDSAEIYPSYDPDHELIRTREIFMEFNPAIQFGSLTSSMLTLLNLALLTEWVEVVRPIWEFQPALVLFFIAFAWVVTFGVMNVIIGMIVDSVVENSRQLQRDELEIKIQKKKRMLDHVREVVEDMDSDGDGNISILDLDRCLDMPSSPLLNLLDDKDLSLHLPVGFSSEELLLMLDENGEETLDSEAFVQSFYRLVDSGPFQQICLVQTGINGMKRRIRRVQQEQRRMFQKLDGRMDLLLRRLEPFAASHSTPVTPPLCEDHVLPSSPRSGEEEPTSPRSAAARGRQEQQPAHSSGRYSSGASSARGRLEKPMCGSGSTFSLGGASMSAFSTGVSSYEASSKLRVRWHDDAEIESQIDEMQATFSELLRRLKLSLAASEVAQDLHCPEPTRPSDPDMGRSSRSGVVSPTIPRHPGDAGIAKLTRFEVDPRTTDRRGDAEANEVYEWL